MERTERDIIEFMKRYKDKPGAMEAQADILAFMGIEDAPILLDDAKQELKDDKQLEHIIRAEYNAYLKKGSKFYCSYPEFIRRKEAGEL